jgi:hypothetical protein
MNPNTKPDEAKANTELVNQMMPESIYGEYTYIIHNPGGFVIHFAKKIK